MVSNNPDQDIVFRGISKSRIDHKSRLHLPAKYRIRMTLALVLSYDDEQKCLRLALKNNHPVNCIDALKKTTTMNDVEVKINKDGRVYLPKRFMAKLGIRTGTNVILVGGLYYMEIWPESAWYVSKNQFLPDDNDVDNLDDLLKLDF